VLKLYFLSFTLKDIVKVDMSRTSYFWFRSLQKQILVPVPVKLFWSRSRSKKNILVLVLFRKNFGAAPSQKQFRSRSRSRPKQKFGPGLGTALPISKLKGRSGHFDHMIDSSYWTHFSKTFWTSTWKKNMRTRQGYEFILIFLRSPSRYST
jgi:hypothetical protein